MTLDVVYLQWCQRFESSKSIGSQGSDFIVAQVTAKKIKINYDLTLCLKITELSHSTLREKRATFTFSVDKSSLKMPKMVHFGEFLINFILRSNSVTRQINLNWTKIDVKCQNVVFFKKKFLIESDLSGNTNWPQVLGFQKLVKNDHFWHF